MELTLHTIDKIAEDVIKIRGIDLDTTSIKMLVITFMLYAVNTFNIKYENEQKTKMRPNAGCIILCQKGLGKSRTIKILKQIFRGIENYRFRKFDAARKKEKLILQDEEKKITPNELQERLNEIFGSEVCSIITDTSTSKALCEMYGQIKKYGLNNLLFNIDEAGDRVFKNAFSFGGSQSSRDFYDSINQLFDGYCGMGKSRTANKEGITSQDNVGANFIFVSTSEFLKDKMVQEKFLNGAEGGLGRRLLFFNSPPIDKSNVSREFVEITFDEYAGSFDTLFYELENKINTDGADSMSKKIDDELKAILSTRGAGVNIPIEEEFLLLNFCVGLSVLTRDEFITKEHWFYMVDLYKSMKNRSVSFVNDKTTTYEKICIFIKNWLNEHDNEKEIPRVLVKDYCLKQRFCYEEKFEKYFDRLLKDFSNTKITRYIIEETEKGLTVVENFAYIDY